MKKVILMFIPALICGVIFTSFGSNKAEPKELEAAGEMSEVSEEWWQPILRKYNLKLGAYNNFDNVFVMGMEGNSINNGICTLKAATVLIKDESVLIKGERYTLLEADSVRYNIEKRTFEFMPVAKKAYALDAELNETSAIHGSIVRIELRDDVGAVVISRSSRTQ
jgi:hypothetical protein